jgi:CRP/FNR family transcriptional regulator, cyclic AMP receptor protein
MVETTHSKFKHEVIETYTDGACIFKEGDVGKDLYVVQHGKVRIFKDVDGEQLEIAVFERGDFFGDIGLLQNIPRIASAFAMGETRLLVLRPAGFLLKIRRDPTFAFEMLQQLSHRVNVANERILELVKRHDFSKSELQKLLRELDGRK